MKRISGYRWAWKFNICLNVFGKQDRSAGQIGDVFQGFRVTTNGWMLRMRLLSDLHAECPPQVIGKKMLEGKPCSFGNLWNQKMEVGLHYLRMRSAFLPDFPSGPR